MESCKGQVPTTEPRSQFSEHVDPGSNSGYQAGQQVLLPAKPLPSPCFSPPLPLCLQGLTLEPSLASNSQSILGLEFLSQIL